MYVEKYFVKKGFVDCVEERMIFISSNPVEMKKEVKP